MMWALKLVVALQLICSDLLDRNEIGATLRPALFWLTYIVMLSSVLPKALSHEGPSCMPCTSETFLLHSFTKKLHSFFKSSQSWMHGIYRVCFLQIFLVYIQSKWNIREVCSDLANEQDCTDYIIKASQKTVLFKRIICSFFSCFSSKIYRAQSVCEAKSFIYSSGNTSLSTVSFCSRS